MRGASFVLALMVVGTVMPHALAQMGDENVRLSKGSPGDSGPKAARQTITINLALKDGQFYLGEIPSQITEESVLAVDHETLLKLGAPILKESMIEAVRKLPVEGGFVKLKDLKETAALPFEFDIGQMSLSFFPTAEQRPSGHISLSQNGNEVPDDQLAQRSAISGYINVNGSAQYTEATALGNAASSRRPSELQLRSASSTSLSKAKPQLAAPEVRHGRGRAPSMMIRRTRSVTWREISRPRPQACRPGAGLSVSRFKSPIRNCNRRRTSGQPVSGLFASTGRLRSTLS